MKQVWADEFGGFTEAAFHKLAVVKSHHVGRIYEGQFLLYGFRRTVHWRGKKFNYVRRYK